MPKLNKYMSDDYQNFFDNDLSTTDPKAAEICSRGDRGPQAWRQDGGQVPNRPHDRACDATALASELDGR